MKFSYLNKLSPWLRRNFLLKLQLLRSLVFLTAVIASLPAAWAVADGTGELNKELSRYDQAAVLLTDEKGTVIYAFNEQQPMVPASTVKLLTGLMALEHWGQDFRAETDFYFDVESRALLVVGRGDPFLVSEEIAGLAAELDSRLKSLAGKITDAIGVKSLVVNYSRFKNQTELSWQGSSTNPYDAIPAALAANFNTVNVNVKQGRPVSAEEQTPLTRFAWQKAVQHSGLERSSVASQTIGRINTGPDVDDAARYFGELLAHMLWQQGTDFIDSSGQFFSRSSSGLDREAIMLMLASRIVVDSDEWLEIDGEPLYTHRNSRALRTVVAAMLQYSTNFIANNLALMLATDSVNQPTDFSDFSDLAQEYARQRFGWKFGDEGIVLEEGAGLSQQNRLSGEHLLQLVGAYKNWPGLLPVYKKSLFGDSVLAKTGSLESVSTLAGTLAADNGREYRFAIMLNDKKLNDSQARDSVLMQLISFAARHSAR